MNGRFGANRELNVGFGLISRMSRHGRLGEVANGRFGAVQFAEPGFGGTTAIGKAGWPDWARSDRPPL